MIGSAIARMRDSVVIILDGYQPSVYLYGSVTTNDFQRGWSDIDLLCLTNRKIDGAEARQQLADAWADTVHRLFEGAFLSLDELRTREYDTVVYWGTSGQRITDTYSFDSFSMMQLKTSGRLLAGPDIRDTLAMPTYDDLRRDVIRHYHVIRKYAATTDGSLYACGWLLDIARCLYTLQTGQVIAKTLAGEWALQRRLCNVTDVMRKTIAVRKNPQIYQGTPAFQAWASQLGPEVQKFADVLEKAIGSSFSYNPT